MDHYFSFMMVVLFYFILFHLGIMLSIYLFYLSWTIDT